MNEINEDYTFRQHALKCLGFRKYFTSVIAGNTVRFIAIVIGLVFLPVYLLNALGEFVCELLDRHTQVTGYFHDDWVKAHKSFLELAHQLAKQMNK